MRMEGGRQQQALAGAAPDQVQLAVTVQAGAAGSQQVIEGVRARTGGGCYHCKLSSPWRVTCSKHGHCSAHVAWHTGKLVACCSVFSRRWLHLSLAWHAYM